MAIKLEDKKAIVAEVNEAAKAALSAVVADARGVTVGAMTGLRKEAREAGVYVRVVRNTCLLYTSPSPRDKRQSRMPSSA